MKGLKGLFIRKIAITAIFLCVPLLFFPSSLFEALGVPAPQPLIFVRLLGVAYLALIVGYYGGIKAMGNNQSSLFAIDMGLVSNGVAFIVFLYFGVTGGWDNWGFGAEVYMWLLLFGALMITINLFRARKSYARSYKAI